MDQHKCLRKHFPCCREGLRKCVAYASFPRSTLPMSRQEIQQSGFEGLPLGTGSELVMCLRAAFGSVALLTCSAHSSERTCSIWGEMQPLRRCCTAALRWGWQLNLQIAVPPPLVCFCSISLFSLRPSGHLVRWIVGSNLWSFEAVLEITC